MKNVMLTFKLILVGQEQLQSAASGFSWCFPVYHLPPQMWKPLSKSTQQGTLEISSSLSGRLQSYEWEHQVTGNRMPTWVSCWHLKLVYMCMCKHWYIISYIMLPIYTVGDSHSLNQHIIFPKYRKVFDLNSYREENAFVPLILIRKLLAIF